MKEKVEDKKIVGAKQTIKAIKNGEAKVVYVAEDAEDKIIRPIVELCREHNVEVINVSSMQRLGNLCGIDVGAATACTI